MPDILHRVGIKTPPKNVFNALATINGLRHWWISDTAGKTRKGGVINFGFCKMKVVESSPKQVRWLCIDGPKEWKGTEVKFQLKPKNGQTFVLFTHSHWRQAVEFMHHCSTKWAMFLMSLKNWLEREEGRPSPYDVKLHVGD